MIVLVCAAYKVQSRNALLRPEQTQQRVWVPHQPSMGSLYMAAMVSTRSCGTALVCEEAVLSDLTALQLPTPHSCCGMIHWQAAEPLRTCMRLLSV